MAFISIILISSSAFYSCTFILHVIFCISNLSICSEMLFRQLSPGCGLTVAVQLQWKARDIQVTSLFLCAGKESRQKMWGELCLQAGSFFFPSRDIVFFQNHWNQPGVAAQPPALTLRRTCLLQSRLQVVAGSHQEVGDKQKYFSATAVEIGNKGEDGVII